MPRGVKKVVDEVTEEVRVEQEPATEAASKTEEAVDEVSKEDQSSEEPVTDSLEVSDTSAEAKDAPAPAKVTITSEDALSAKEETKPAKKAESVEVNESSVEGEWTFVENLRMYPNPSNLAVSTMISGNIKVISEYKGLKRIQYMKHGFGLVEAVTDALN